jgi:hypothetical protein
MRHPSHTFLLSAVLLGSGHCLRAQDLPVPRQIVSPLGKTMTLKFDDEFNAVTDKDGHPYIDRSKWQTTFWQGSADSGANRGIDSAEPAGRSDDRDSKRCLDVVRAERRPR